MANYASVGIESRGSMGDIKFDGRVAIVTGAGNGLGRSHAKELAARGAKVIVNDIGGLIDGSGASDNAAESVVAEIISAGGQALAHDANVCIETEVQDMVAMALTKWGAIDILVNNAGILRDKSFVKMSISDFKAVVDVHLIGSANCAKAVWEPMRERKYGRIAMTSSSSGIYGNFGQSNYGAAKLGVIGLMNVLHLEGEKYGIKVNALAPTAATRMTENLLPEEALKLLTVESVSAGLVYLVSEGAPSRLILCAGAGGYAATRIYETEGIGLPVGEQTAENVALHIDEIINPKSQQPYTQGAQQAMKFLEKAAALEK
jgi:NAD(P)-dependent dehydrogenase (short-subunit alcohol dehydrogenase family)